MMLALCGCLPANLAVFRGKTNFANEIVMHVNPLGRWLLDLSGAWATTFPTNSCKRARVNSVGTVYFPYNLQKILHIDGLVFNCAYNGLQFLCGLLQFLLLFRQCDTAVVVQLRAAISTIGQSGEQSHFSHLGGVAVHPQGRSGGFRRHGRPAFPVWYIRLQIPAHFKARLPSSAENPVYGRQHDPPALCPGQSHISVHGQKAGRGQALLRLHRGRCRQVSACLLCQGKGVSGGVGQRSKYRR